MRNRSQSSVVIQLALVLCMSVRLHADSAADEYGKQAMRHLNEISTITGSRATGSPGAERAAEYLVDQLSSYGYEVERVPFTAHRKGTVYQCKNLFARKNNSDTNKTILICAHYDLAASNGLGADDNASGVAVLLALAESAMNLESKCSLVFAFFDAEEMGMKGSSDYIRKLTADQLSSLSLVINIDSLLAGDYVYLHRGEGNDLATQTRMLCVASAFGYELVLQPGNHPDFPAGTVSGMGDYAPFDEAGVPFLAFEATNWDKGELDGYIQTDESRGKGGEIWHTKFDTLEYIESYAPGRAVKRLGGLVLVLYDFIFDKTMEL